MRRLDFLILKEYDGISVKDYSRKKLKMSARVFIKQKYADDGIMINGRRCKSNELLRSGDILSIQIPDDNAEYDAVDLGIDVIFEDEDFLIVNKRYGMPVHPSSTHKGDSLLNAVAFYYRKNGLKTAFRPIYRLDKDTSGIVVIAKNRLAVSSTKIDKDYFAVCEGVITGSGIIDEPIGLKKDSIMVREVGHGVRAVTQWEAVKNDGIHSLIKCKLVTGRTHQIRVHFSSIGHPLAGDDLYGGGVKYINRQALHCKTVRISCEILSFNREVNIDFPDDMKNSFNKLC